MRSTIDKIQHYMHYVAFYLPNRSTYLHNMGTSTRETGKGKTSNKNKIPTTSATLFSQGYESGILNQVPKFSNNQQPWRGGHRRPHGRGHGTHTFSENIESFFYDFGQQINITGAFICQIPSWHTLKRHCDKITKSAPPNTSLSVAWRTSNEPASTNAQPQSFRASSNARNVSPGSLEPQQIYLMEYI